MKRRLTVWGRSLRLGLGLYAPVTMLALLPTLSSWIGNRYQVSVQDLIVPVIVDLLIAVMVTAVFWRLWQRDRPAGYVAATLATLIFASNFDGRIGGLKPLFTALSPIASLGGFTDTAFYLACIVVIFALSGWLGRWFSRLAVRHGWNAREISNAALIMITVTFSFQFLTVAKDLAFEWSQFFYQPPKITAGTSSAVKPDIYYIVLDRYASEDVLKQQFSFDNSNFLDFLKDNNYYVNPSAHNNYPYTTMSIASTMDADYLNDIVDKYGSSSQQTIIPFNETIRKSPVAERLKSLGYEYSIVGNWYETSNLSDVADKSYEQNGQLTVLGHTFTLNNFSKIMLTVSPFSPIVRSNLALGGFTILGYENKGDIDLAHQQLSQLKELASTSPGGRFIFAHVVIPHEPYYFNADGSLDPNINSDNTGEPVRQKYLGQVQYINGKMKEILKEINDKSNGQAVVVLQSDEGPYPFQLNETDFNQTTVNGEIGEIQAGDMRKWSDSSLRMKLGNLAAYHIPAADFGKDAGAADSVNVFRLVLNSYFNAGLPYLPDCYYIYPDGRNRPDTFVSTTSRLTGQPEDSRCQDNGTVTR